MQQYGFWIGDREYLLTEEQAAIVDEKDAEFPSTDEGDKAFQEFFKGFVKEHNLKPVNKRLARYWAGSSGAYNTSDDLVKLAVTMRAMRSIVGVVDPEHKLSVSYKDDLDTSLWQDNEVLLPTAPIREMPTLFDAINVEGGFAVHEAIHSKHTRPLLKPGVVTFLQESPTNMVLANLIEDVRGEVEEMKENPGFQSYLNNVMEYLWEKYHNALSIPEFANADADAKIQAAITGVRYPEKNKVDPSWKSAIDAINEVIEKFSAKPTSAGLMDSVTQIKSILEITPEDEQEQKNQGNAGGAGANLLACGYTDGDDGLDEMMASKVEGLVDEEVENLDPKIFGAGQGEDADYAPSMTVLKPKVVDPSRVSKLTGLLSKAKAAIQLRRAAPRADERNMLSGEVDEDDLYRLTQGDMRVFRDITEEVVPSAAVYLLVDLSGSMARPFDNEALPFFVRTTHYDDDGSCLHVAQQFATLLVEAMRPMQNVTTRVLAHTGDNDGTLAGASGRYGGRAAFYRLWEQGDPMNRLSLIRTITPGNNYDGYAIAWAGSLLAQENAEQKLLIVLSDGIPYGRGYMGDYAKKNTAKHVENLKKKGIETIQIAISTELNESDQREMFGKNYVAAKGKGNQIFDTALKELQRLMLKVSTR